MNRDHDHRTSWTAVDRRRPDRAFRLGLLASVSLHALLFFLWRTSPPEAAASATGPELARVVRLEPSVRVVEPAAAVDRRSIPPPPRPALAVAPPALHLSELPSSTEGALLEPAGPVGAPTLSLGAWPSEPGGEARGPDAPPVPRSILPNWVVPNSVQGREMNVRVYVTSGGRAIGGVRLDPPTPDRGFNRRVADRVRRLEYRPGLRNGRAVGAWAEITFVFCPTTVTATSPPSRGPATDRPCPEPPPDGG